MAATEYTYTISTDFPNGKVAPDRLTDEIQSSIIVTALDRIDVNESADTCSIWFKEALSSGDQTILDTIVAAHSGESLAPPATDVKINGARFDSDGKQVIVPTPAPGGSFTWYTSCGDQLSPFKRGEGQGSRITYAIGETGTKNVVVQFAEGVYLHDGEINWKPVDSFSGEDLFSVYVEFDATAITPNPSNTGNCTLYGGYVVIPAAGNGDYDVDLSAAVPIPDSSGPWSINERTEEITIYDENVEKGKYDQRIQILTVTPPSMYLCRNVALGSPRGLFEIDAYLVEWISRHWKLGMEVQKNFVPTSACEINGFMMLFRWHATSD